MTKKIGNSGNSGKTAEHCCMVSNTTLNEMLKTVEKNCLAHCIKYKGDCFEGNNVG
jgi:hypothetical protein